MTQGGGGCPFDTLSTTPFPLPMIKPPALQPPLDFSIGWGYIPLVRNDSDSLLRIPNVIQFLRDTFLNKDDISGWFLIPLVGLLVVLSPWYQNVDSVGVKVLYVVVIGLFLLTFTSNSEKR